jgi:ATP-dependent Clp protease adapter protein ClpS
MCDVPAETGDLQVIFHNDDETPKVFVIELLHSVFKQPIADAAQLTETVENNGQAICGTYPHDVANELLEAARQRIRASGHPLLITSEAAAAGSEKRDGRCKLCGALSSTTRLSLKGTVTSICDDCMDAGAVGGEFVQRCFSELESAVNAARCYRGKILSLDSDADYRGRSKGVMVHKLPSVQREDVILPEATLKLLDRNVLSFVKSRAQLAGWTNRPARVSCFMDHPEPARPIPSAIWRATCPVTPP